MRHFGIKIEGFNKYTIPLKVFAKRVCSNFTLDKDLNLEVVENFVAFYEKAKPRNCIQFPGVL